MPNPNSLKRILYIPFDHLNVNHGAMRYANKDEDLILMVESQRMVNPDVFNRHRLFFLISSARHFALEVERAGFTTRYIKALTTAQGIREVQAEVGGLPVFAANQSSFRLQESLESLGVTFCENDFFLTEREVFKEWADGQKSFLMENFYRKQRVRLNLLMDGAKPLGGEWNFDKENREPLPKNYAWTPYLTHSPDEIDKEVANSLDIQGTQMWATTRGGALAQLENFLENHFANFGRYEDAMSSENWAVHHSLLSPYLNNGLIHPQEVVEAALRKFEDGSIPIASCEAFIRQIIGWREYINGMYWYLGQTYKEQNQLGSTRKLLPLFSDPSRTDMNCLKSIVTDINERAWLHHIPRLMVLSNMALLAGVEPQEFLTWMRNTFIDASDWVMVPNVVGMGMHADGGLMMTKPYISGGAYISKMSNYCKGCTYDPKKRTGEDACPFTTLYWNFLDIHSEDFAKNHRMAQQFAGLKRLNDFDEVRVRANQVLQGLEEGKI